MKRVQGGGRMANTTPEEQDTLDAAVLRRLLHHLGERTDVQNIDLMILAGFCRNCLSRWYEEEAAERGISVDRDEARMRMYGMPYSQWKRDHQQPASAEQLQAFAELESKKGT
jgi:hypothetical protein